MNAQPHASLGKLGILTGLVLAAHLAIIGAWRGPVWAPASTPPHQPTTLSLALVPPAAPIAQASTETAHPATPQARPKTAIKATPQSATQAPAEATPQASDASLTDTSSLAAQVAPATSTNADSTATQTQASNKPEPSPTQTTEATSSTSTQDATNAAGAPDRQPLITQAGTAAMRLPEALKLRYKLQGQAKGFAYSARGEMWWLPQGDRYEARLEISAFLLGSRVQTSRGDITEQGLRPQRFSDKVRSEVAAHFEWDEGRVIFSANSPQAVLQAGAQDHLSAFVALAGMLAADLPRYLPDGEIRLQAIGPREADLWRVQMNGPETLDLPIGRLNTYKLTRPPVKPYDLHVEMWMAPSLGFLPARIRLTQHNGDFIDQLLQESVRP